jgi:hypothetical protein
MVSAEGLHPGAGQRVPGGACAGQEHRLSGLCLADPGRFCHALCARAPPVGVARPWTMAQGARATMALSSNRKTMDGDREFVQLRKSCLMAHCWNRKPMNTATITLTLTLNGFFARRNWLDWLFAAHGRRGRAVCLLALQRATWMCYEKASCWAPCLRPSGWAGSGARCAQLMLVVAGFRCWPSAYQGECWQRARAVFWLKYFLSSQSAILWMSMLFFMSTRFTGSACFAARATPWSCLGSRLAWVAVGMALIGTMVRWYESYLIGPTWPHPGEQPVRSVRDVLLDDGGVLPVL